MRTRANQNEDAITLASNTEGLSSPGPRHQPIRGLSDPNMVLGGQEDSPRIRYDTFEELEPNDVIRPVEDGDDDGDDDDRQVLYTPPRRGMTEPCLRKTGYEFREFSVKPLNYGFIIRAGCHQFAIETPERLAYVISEYVLNPNDKETKWWEEKKI